MNRIQRRLFRGFINSGGDLTNEAEVEQFIRYVESNLFVLPPKVRAALETLWHQPQPPSYTTLAARISKDEGGPVTSIALRQRISRGLRTLEDSIRHASWTRRRLDLGFGNRVQR
jgi:hypothetical protein